MADAGDQQVAAAGDNPDMASEEPQQRSRLLSLAPELRNAIYELSVTDLTCTVQVEIIASGSLHQGRVVHPDDILRFKLGLSGLYYACRSTHNEFPLSDFYANNTFIFGDSAMDEKVLNAFILTCPEAARSIRSIRVSIARENTSTPCLTEGIFNVNFALRKLDNGKVKVEELRTIAEQGSTYSEDEVCLCELLQLAGEGTRQNHSAVVVLRDFLAVCDYVGAPDDRFRWYDRAFGTVCPGCGTPELRGPG
ncbi:hypothetical protein LTR56_024686 [Elasticomyces elasticus]|nr:hypothetical protein LTR56_024686 [Elasticomyces elasticus]KAK3622199.1 hypothetical protein LTR22_024901 [Elasticomyces elasticus]KAK4907812.1 hypothetical protein LTR49_023210 [Elasticomyces elasticus]KAK5747975.1 hypothetical protein LTS12_021971 [Elasticomyces elasticus]